MNSGVELIADERKRQIEENGYTAEHDDAHDQGELVNFAICLAKEDGAVYDKDERNLWPQGWACPERALNDRVVELAMAGALIAAEIDRLQRLRGVAVRQ